MSISSQGRTLIVFLTLIERYNLWRNTQRREKPEKCRLENYSKQERKWWRYKSWYHEMRNKKRSICLDHWGWVLTINDKSDTVTVKNGLTINQMRQKPVIYTMQIHTWENNKDINFRKDIYWKVRT